MNISVSMQGLGDLVEKLDGINEDIRTKRLLEIATMAGTMVVERAKENAPVAEGRTPKGHKPGTLKAKGIGMGIFRRTRGPESVTVGIGFTKKGWYGVFSELGTSRQSPHPMIVPAYDSLKPQILAEIGNVISRTVRSWEEGVQQRAFRH